MSSVLADFAAQFTVETKDWDGPQNGRVRLSETRLILAVDEDETASIVLGTIFDVTIGTMPQFIDSMPGTPVTIGFREGTTYRTAVVSADEETSEKFRTVLFKLLLNGTYTTLKHPAKVGGRVLDTSFRASLLSLESGCVRFDTDEGPVTLPVKAVIDFDRQTHTIEGEQRPVLVVSHVEAGDTLTTLVATDSTRKLSLLGRFLQRDYRAVIASLQSLQLSEQETEALTTLYAIGDASVSLPSVLALDTQTVRRLLQALHQKGLIESGEHAPVLTARGQIVVTEYLERVNE